MDERERSAEDIDGEGEVDERAEAEAERRARVGDGGDSSSDDESRTVSADLNPRAVVAISGLIVRDKNFDPDFGEATPIRSAIVKSQKNLNTATVQGKQQAEDVSAGSLHSFA